MSPWILLPVDGLISSECSATCAKLAHDKQNDEKHRSRAQAKSAPSATCRPHINSATLQQLMDAIGIGAGLAHKIISH